MSGSSDLLHVVKADPSNSVDPHFQPQEMGKANAQAKGNKGKGKGKGKAKGNPNPVRDGPPESAPARELAAGRHGADHWDGDDLRYAWAGHLSQPHINGGHQPHHSNQQYHHPRHHRPDGRSDAGWDQGPSDAGMSGGGGGGHAHTGQKRRATAMATNGTTADDGGGWAAKRHKGNSRPSGQGAGAGGAALPHPDFWHPDGSVIVEVGKTGFKLHQSTLQKHSAYFADAFRKKGGGHQGGNRTQLPVYRVDETTAEDFASLLTVIEEPMCVFFFWFLLEHHHTG